MAKRRGPPSQGWRTFLRNHSPNIGAMDLFVVPTLGFDLLYAFVIIRLDRRDLVWINVTTSPTAEWIARQLTEAFPWNEVPHYLIRDRDRIYGSIVTRRMRTMGIRDKPIAPASPWQNGFAERLIGSIRRECLDHLFILSETHLRRILQTYACYYNNIRTHRSLDKDAPAFRSVQRRDFFSGPSRPALRRRPDHSPARVLGPGARCSSRQQRNRLLRTRRPASICAGIFSEVSGGGRTKVISYDLENQN
jgi:transposase InsO family protein